MTNAESEPGASAGGTIYCISGLGATRRLFRYLQIPGHTVRPLDWITPIHDEPLSDYAHRMAGGIEIPEPILLGVSFGGVVALEMAQVVRPRLVVLVSSVKSRSEVPWYLRVIGTLRLHRLFPFALLRYMGPLIRFFNGTSGQRDTEVINEIIDEMDLEHIAWGLDKLLRWNGCEIGGEIWHVHGNRDRVFPIRYVEPDVDVIVDGGAHVMIVSQAEQISRLIGERLGGP